MNHDRLMHDLAFLTSPAVMGRLSGTEGARQVAVYLSAQLESMGFQSFLQPVDVPAARLIGAPRLKVANQVTTYRLDFAEISSLSAGGSVSGQLLVVREDDQLLPESLKGRVVLMPERPHGFNLAETVKTAEEMGVAGLLVEQGEPQWFHKTIFGGNGRIPVLRVRKSTAERLASMNRATVDLSLPLEFRTLPCRNLIGLLLGKSTGFTLALTAHYDHLGDDPGGARFPGAFDNASGVAAVLEATRQLVQNDLPFNLLVAFLTGEETGLWGAKQLLANPPLPISAVINLDSVGSDPNLQAMRLGHRQRGDWLAELAESILVRRGIQAQWIGGSDDSSVFISRGIPTVGLGEQPQGSKRSVMHTPFDTLEALHLETVDESVSVILEIVNTLSLKRTGENQMERNLTHVAG